MIRALSCVLALALALAPADAAAERPGDRAAAERAADRAAAELSRASAALERGELGLAASLAEAVAVAAEPVPAADRAEAWRLLGLARFFAGDRAAAEDAFLGYLRLEPESHLDPALVPPEAIVFFEDVRARHAAELDALLPQPGDARSVWLNLVPSGGQFQNGEPTKAWLVLGGVAVFAGANATSYLLLRSWCERSTGVCGDGGDRNDAARAAQIVNLLSGVGLISVYAYSVVDGYLGYRRLERADERERGPSWSLVPFGEGSGIGVVGRF